MNGWDNSQPIFSEHDPEMILQLRKLGMPISQSKKRTLSLVAGIAKLKEWECFYSGENFKREIENYKYITAKDLLTGKEILTNEPMDGMDHLCSASRYAAYTDSFYTGPAKTMNMKNKLFLLTSALQLIAVLIFACLHCTGHIRL